MFSEKDFELNKLRLQETGRKVARHQLHITATQNQTRHPSFVEQVVNWIMDQESTA